MPDQRDHYQTLNLSPNATLAEIKQAFRQLARRFHPDLHPGDPQAAEKFRQIRQSYEILANETQRRQYDRARQQQAAPKQTISPQVYYVRGVEKSLIKDYAGAIENFTRAIAANSNFVEAYLKRAEMYLEVNRDREVLEDSAKILKLQPNTARAYYYRARARHNLGYTDSAIQSYSQAVSIDPELGIAFYYRGIAYLELRYRSNAIRDWQEYAEICRDKGDRRGYQAAMEALDRNSWKLLNVSHYRAGELVANARRSLGKFVRAVWRVSSDPIGGALPVYAGLSRLEAAGMGLGFATLAGLGFAIGLASRVPLSWLQLLAIGYVPFISLMGISAIARLINRNSGEWAGDVFLAGAALIPFGLLFLVTGLWRLPRAVLLLLALYSFSYSLLSLYGSCTQVAHLSDRWAAFVVPLMVGVSSWISVLAFVAIARSVS